MLLIIWLIVFICSRPGRTNPLPPSLASVALLAPNSSSAASHSSSPSLVATSSTSTPFQALSSILPPPLATTHPKYYTQVPFLPHSLGDKQHILSYWLIATFPHQSFSHNGHWHSPSISSQDSTSSCSERSHRRNQAMADAAAQQALANALTALTAVLTNLQAAPGAGAPGGGGGGHVAVTTDPFQSNDAFDLASRAGSNAYAMASAVLDVIWDGTIEKFPSFLIALRIRSSEANWGAAAPHGILTYTVAGEDKNLFDNYDSITEAILETSRAARVDNRAIQNSRTLYKCLKVSIGGDLKGILFDQQGNLPTHEDGPTLFKRLTLFTMAASLQLSMISFQQILEFNPAEHNFNIAVINTKLNHLFVLATTRQRSLGQPEWIQHTLTVYARIKQPELWAQWFEIKKIHLMQAPSQTVSHS